MPIFATNPKVNFTRSQRVSSNMIDGWDRDGALRRPGRKDVMIRVSVLQYSWLERQGRLVDPTDRKALVAAYDIDGNIIAQPDPDKDRLITFLHDAHGNTLPSMQVDESLMIIGHPGRMDMNGVLVFWRMQVRR